MFLFPGPKPRVRDHFHSHRLSFWLQLIPRLIQEQQTSSRHGFHPDEPLYGGGGVDQSRSKSDVGLRYIQHHLLDNYDDPSSYEGGVRQITLGNMVPFAGGQSSRTASVPSGSLFQMNSDQSAFNSSGKYKTSEGMMNSNHVDGGNTGSHQSNNSNDSTSSGTGSTALSVTLAIGGSLLVLNVLIFTGVYYQLNCAKHCASHPLPRSQSGSNSFHAMYCSSSSSSGTTGLANAGGGHLDSSNYSNGTASMPLDQCPQQQQQASDVSNFALLCQLKPRER